MSRGSVEVEVPAATSATSGDRLLLGDLEAAPLAELLVEASTETGADRRRVRGSLRSVRSPRDRDLTGLRRAPSELVTAGPRVVVVAGRPALAEDVAQVARLRADGRDVVVLVPSVAPTPDGVPVPLVVRSVRRGFAGAEVVAVPLAWRGTDVDTGIARAAAAAYGATATALLLPQDTRWRSVLDRLDGPDDVRGPRGELDDQTLRDLRRWRPAPHRRGLVVMLTGLSGSGKSTLAAGLRDYVHTSTDRSVTLLDGDVTRRLLTSDLGLDRPGREQNVRRLGWVASEVARHGGLAVCAAIAPYASTRAEVRSMVRPHGDFVLVHVATPLAECERRDRKGLYARARSGDLVGMTGIDDPYEVPEDADLVIDTSAAGEQDSLDVLVGHLTARGWLTPDAGARVP